MEPRVSAVGRIESRSNVFLLLDLRGQRRLAAKEMNGRSVRVLDDGLETTTPFPESVFT